MPALRRMTSSARQSTGAQAASRRLFRKVRGLTTTREFERIKADFVTLIETLEGQLKRAVAEAGEMRVLAPDAERERTVKITAKNEQLHQLRLTQLEREYHDTVQHSKHRPPKCGTTR